MSTTGSLAAARKARGLGPILAALVLAAVGWWIYGSIRQALQEQLAHDLKGELAGTRAALEVWLETQRARAAAVADDPRFRDDLLAAASREARGATVDELRAAPALERLRASLGPHVHRLGFQEFVVTGPDGRNLAALYDPTIGDRALAERGSALGRVLAGEPAMVLPFLADFVPGEYGKPASGSTMFVAAPVRDADGQVVAALALRMDPARGFTRLLSASRGGVSRETFAFDADGRLLSPSRFETELRGAGWLGDDVGAGGVLVVDLRDPGGDVTAGHRPQLERTSLPLTRMACDAIAGREGVDVDGYPSYLGRPVIGAWTWLADPVLGIAVEGGVDDAFGILSVLRNASWVLLGLLALAAGAGAVIARRNIVLQRKVRAAERAVKQLGQYSLVKKIGEGGMGEVYYARHAMLRRPCAIKLLRPDKTSEQTIARFEREVQETSRLTHPNTIQIYDYGRTPGGTFYYVMEYLVGVSLDEFVETEGPLPEGRVIYILQQICASLNEAHALGLVHRDIKPANIALCTAGAAYDVVKVLDFGLVMDRDAGTSQDGTVSGTITGTPAYLSPEAIKDPASVDARSDLYAVGAVGYFLLTGQQVFEGENVLELINKQLKEKPRPPSERLERPVHHDLELALLACLEKTPAKRPKDANALARELEWCHASANWNRDKARHWWIDHERRLEQRYGLSSKAPATPVGGTATVTIDLDARAGPV
jgi:serine/threonine protein kinase